MMYCIQQYPNMADITDIFMDSKIIEKIKKKLPYLFTIAEAEASRGGRLGMGIGSVRERVIISLLRYYFGKENISDKIAITEKEIDVKVCKQKISIKTKTGNQLSGIKAVWTVDWNQVDSFVKSFSPSVGMLLIQIVWNEEKGGLFFIPKNVQDDVFNNLGRDDYFKKPQRKTNPRGVEYSKTAIKNMLHHKDTRKIKINWIRDNTNIDIYKKWDEYWESD